MANNTLLASDNFASGSLAAGWSMYNGVTAFCQVISGSPNYTEPSALSVGSGQIWTGLTWPNDQISEITMTAFTSEANTITVLVVRQSATTAANYQVNLTNATALIYSTAAGGAQTQLGSTVTGLTFAAGDTYTFMAAGSCITLYQNGLQIFRYIDSTLSSGYPGFAQYTSVNITHTKVASWRGYSAIQKDGIWTKQGVVLPTISADYTSGAGGQANPAMLYEGNAQVLSGTVYKMWFSTGGPGAEQNIYYAESTDGITWTRKAGAVISGYGSPFIIKNAGTYYIYAQPNSSPGGGLFAQFTSSDGINWTLAHSNVITLGVSGWDSVVMWYFQPLAIIAGTWYAVYSATNDSTAYQLKLGMATSPDGVTWTKYAGNPVLTGANSGSVVNSQAFAQVGSTYYMWMFGNQPNVGGGSLPNLDPGEGIRYQTTDFINWTNPVHSVHRTQFYEGVNFGFGQCYPNNIFTVGSQTYMYIQSAAGDFAAPEIYQISLATAPATIAQIVTQNEDAAPQIASDNFTSGLGSLSANWTVPTGGSAAKIVAGPYVEPTVLSTRAYEVYTGATFSADQYSEITIRTLATSADNITPTVRMSTTALTSYALNLNGIAPAITSMQLFKEIAGVFTLLFSQKVTYSVGDVIRLQVVGNVLSAFQNGFMVFQVEDVNNSITSGNPGFLMFASDAIASAQISSWAGGNANVSPAYSSGGGSSSWLTVALANGLRGVHH